MKVLIPPAGLTLTLRVHVNTSHRLDIVAKGRGKSSKKSKENLEKSADDKQNSSSETAGVGCARVQRHFVKAFNETGFSAPLIILLSA